MGSHQEESNLRRSDETLTETAETLTALQPPSRLQEFSGLFSSPSSRFSGSDPGNEVSDNGQAQPAAPRAWAAKTPIRPVAANRTRPGVKRSAAQRVVPPASVLLFVTSAGSRYPAQSPDHLSSSWLVTRRRSLDCAASPFGSEVRLILYDLATLSLVTLHGYQP